MNSNSAVALALFIRVYDGAGNVVETYEHLGGHSSKKEKEENSRP